MIYITGDTHGDFKRFSTKRLRRAGMELPTEGELQEGLRNLERYHYEVDYVITHCCASTLQDRINAGTGRSCALDLLTDYLETLEQKLHYRH